MIQEERVVITGWGFYGEEFYQSCFESYGNELTEEGDRKLIFAQGDAPDAKALLPGKSTRLVDRQSIIAGIAAGRAGGRYLDAGSIGRDKTGVVLGSTFGSMVSILRFHKSILTDGGNFVNPTEFPNVVANAAASRLGIWYGLKGRCVALSDGMLSGIDARGFAYDDIRRGSVEHYFAGDTEELSGELFEAYRKISGDGEETAGISAEVLCEGAGIAVVSGLTAAKACNMNILGEIAGYVNIRYREEEFFTGKILDSVMRCFTGGTDPDYGSYVFLSSHHSPGKMSGLLEKEAETRFGKDGVHMMNRRDGLVVNCFGLHGVMNVRHAFDCLGTAAEKKGALVVEADDEGKISALFIKNFE